MNREYLEELLSRSLDEELTGEERKTLDRALAESEAFRLLAQDLRALRELASSEEPQPAPHIRVALQERVDRVYGHKRARFLSLLPFPRLALAFACTLLLALAALLFRSPGPGETRIEEPITSTPFAQIRAEVLRTQHQFHQALEKMEIQAIARLQELPPEITLELADQLHVINQAIASAEELADSYPDNYLAYASLSRAYEAKVDLLDKILSV